MRTITTHPVPPDGSLPAGHAPDVVVEVDGRLDAVSAHDLRRAVGSLIQDGRRHLHLDLSRVSDADPDGVAGLARCSQDAILADRVLTWSRCSGPLLRVLRAHGPPVEAALSA